MNTFTKKWIRALRSGKYNQARGRLISNKGPARYCCLGVGLKLLYPKIKDFDEIVKKHNRNDWSMPKPANCKLMGIDKKVSCTLAGLNDDKKWNFKKIADYLAGKIDADGGKRS